MGLRREGGRGAAACNSSPGGALADASADLLSHTSMMPSGRPSLLPAARRSCRKSSFASTLLKVTAELRRPLRVGPEGAVERLLLVAAPAKS